MGGAGFPTKVKLSPKEPDKIEYIIANCAGVNLISLQITEECSSIQKILSAE